MIRPFEPQDTDAVLDIWLRGSVSAHSFIDLVGKTDGRHAQTLSAFGPHFHPSG